MLRSVAVLVTYFLVGLSAGVVSARAESDFWWIFCGLVLPAGAGLLATKAVKDIWRYGKG